MNCLLKLRALCHLPIWQKVGDPEGYDLIRWDEFDYLSDYWKLELPWQIEGCFRYDSDQVYIPQLQDQVMLRLKPGPGYYRAGCLSTPPMFGIGTRIQVKCRFNAIRGFFPALWLLSDPMEREYDFMECNDGKKVFMTVHRWNPHKVSRGNFAMKLPVEEWHIYEIELLADRVNWYLNGLLVQVHKKWLPTSPMRLIMSVGCTEEYNLINQAPAMYIDWVKIFTHE